MAIVSVEETFSRRPRVTDQEAEYVRVYRVISDSITESEDAVIEADDLPQLGDAHEDNATALVRSVVPEQDESAWTLWQVTVTWSTASGGQTPPTPPGQDPATPPLERDPELSFSVEPIDTICREAKLLNGIPPYVDPSGIPPEEYKYWRSSIDPPLDPPDKNIPHEPRTSAGEPFTDPPVIVTGVSVGVVTYVRNEATFNADLAMQRHNAINTAAWNGIPKWECKIAAISAIQQQETIGATTYTYWQVTYVFHINKQTWHQKLVDRGTKGLRTDISLANRQLPQYPLMEGDQPAVKLLDGEGSALETGLDGKVYLKYRVYQVYLNELNFDVLGITF